MDGCRHSTISAFDSVKGLSPSPCCFDLVVLRMSRGELPWFDFHFHPRWCFRNLLLVIGPQQLLGKALASHFEAH